MTQGSSSVAKSSSVATDQSSSILPMSVTSGSLGRRSSSPVTVSSTLEIDLSRSALPSVSYIMGSSSAMASTPIVVSSSPAKNISSSLAVSSRVDINHSTSALPPGPSVLVPSVAESSPSVSIDPIPNWSTGIPTSSPLSGNILLSFCFSQA